MTATTSRSSTDSAEPTDRNGVASWLALESDERLRWRGRPRIQTVYPWLAGTVFAMAAIAAGVVLEFLTVLALGWIPILAAIPVWPYVRLARTEFVITDHRLAIRRGVVGVSVRTVGLEQVQNTTVTQGALETVIDAGTVSIETASGSTLAFRSVDAPLEVRAELERAADGSGRAGIPGTRAQWTAIRDAVRDWRVALEERNGDERR
ncbi:PH domain-containing protein [Natronococcus sp. A-GB1]|uniref:PH domain-containing protein n=1 Tax=Natronococcus sp. A-GB1 TaxID=3037648 RepID=UPI00242004C1|nr:PH domain-containing protein [Natronococcus sp. A-GB1]MDG5760074.1 PH domain-containing protein [Natronococcus sp. A-GB1]